MYEKLIINGIKKDSIIWEHHGEVISEPNEFDDDDQNNCNDGVRDMLHDLGSAMNIENITGAEEITYTTSTNTNSVNKEKDKFSKLFFLLSNKNYIPIVRTSLSYHLLFNY